MLSRKPYVNVNRWFDTMVNQPLVKAILGEVPLCDKVAQAGSAGGDHKKHQHHDKQQHGKKQEKQQKQQEKKPVEKAEPEEPEEPKIEKPKDPMAHLAKGSFDMDDFKRFYSNNDEDKSIPYFWEKFDKENYSIWRGDYKYNDELTQVFMSCNLIGGEMD